MRPESKFGYVNHDLWGRYGACAQASFNVRFGSGADILRASTDVRFPQKRTLSLASSLASPFAIDGQTILALTAPAQYSVFPRIFRKKLRVVRALLVDVGRITSLVFVSCFSVNAS